MSDDRSNPPDQKKKIRFRVKCRDNRNTPIARIISVADEPSLHDYILEADLNNGCSDLKWKELAE